MAKSSIPKWKRRIRWLQKNYQGKDGRFFTTKDRKWIEDLFRALDGYQLWPRDKQKLCSSCRKQIMCLWDDNKGVVPHGTCLGLEAKKVYVAVLDAERRGGKSFACSGYELTEVFLNFNQQVGWVAPAGDQSKRILRQNWIEPIQRSTFMSEFASLEAGRTIVKSTNGSFEVFKHSPASVAGSGLTLVDIEEARDIKDEVAAKLIPSVYESHGWACRVCNFRPTAWNQDKDCPQCGEVVDPWFARIIIKSSSGIESETEGRSWFYDLVRKLDEEPNPHFYLFQGNRLGRTLNPDVDKAGIKSAVSEVLTKIDGIGDYLIAEHDNVPVKKGRQPLSTDQVAAVINQDAKPTTKWPYTCYGCLDTATVVELTTLSVLGEWRENPAWRQDDPWRWVKQLRLDTFDPINYGGSIDETIIIPHLDRVMRAFPGLLLVVDNRNKHAWVKRLKRATIKREYTLNRKLIALPWGRRVEYLEKTSPEPKRIGWGSLIEHVTGKTITLLPHKRWKAEIKNARWQESPTNQTTNIITEHSRKKGRHLEISDTTALALWWQIEKYMSLKMGLAELQENKAEGEDKLAEIFRSPLGNFDKFSDF